jgi:hypothetical protein
MNTVTFSIDESTGNTIFLVDEETKAFLDYSSTVRRASNVEPVFLPLRLAFKALRYQFGETGRVSDWTRNWNCLWRVNLAPVHGPILPIDFANRQTAIDWEVKWLNENFL